MRRVLLGIAILILAGGGIYLALNAGKMAGSATANQPTSPTPAIPAWGPRPVKASKSIVAEGVVVPVRNARLSLQISGPVTAIPVKPGDQVRQGDILLQIENADLKLAVEQARANLSGAAARLAQAKNAAPQDIQVAQAQVTAAEANYNKLKAGATASDLAAARAAINSAQAAQDAAIKAAASTGSQLEAAKAALDKTQANLRLAQSSYDRVASLPDISGRPESVNLQNATIDYQQARANYEALANTSGADSQSRIEAAATQFEQAKANLAKLENAVTENDLAASQAQVTQARENLNKLQNPAKETLAIAQAAVDTAQVTLQQAEINVGKAQLVAPFSGTVVSIDPTVGEWIQAGTPILRLADISSWQVETRDLSELNVTRLETGTPVTLTFDAIPGLILPGRVTRIALLGESRQGEMTYTTTVQPERLDDRLRWNMTAKVSITPAE